jgi:hypothetical protein
MRYAFLLFLKAIETVLHKIWCALYVRGNA